jgi:hypothetical protein
MHAETIAMSTTVDQLLLQRPQRSCTIFTDCENLVQEIQQIGDANLTSLGENERKACGFTQLGKFRQTGGTRPDGWDEITWDYQRCHS